MTLPEPETALTFGNGSFRFEGLLEYYSHGWIIGWVWVPSEPDARVAVELVKDGGAVAAGIANLKREDIEKTGRGDGCYGFRIHLPLGKGQSICARIANSEFCLPGVLTSLEDLDRSIIGVVERVVGINLKGWCWIPAEPERTLTVTATFDGQIVASSQADEFRADLLTAGMGDGHHAFVLRLPLWMADGLTRSVTVTAGRDTALAGSPAQVHAISGGPMAVLNGLRQSLQGCRTAAIENQLALLSSYLAQTEELLPNSLPWRDYEQWRPPHAATGPEAEIPAGTLAFLGDPAEVAVLLDDGATALPGALTRALQIFRETQADILYADAEVETALGLIPWFRPDWSYDLFLAQDYTRGLMLIGASIADRLPPGSSPAEIKIAAVEAARPDHIIHLPEVLSHLTDCDGSGDGSAWLTAIRGHLARRNVAARVEPFGDGWRRRVRWLPPNAAPFISLIVPTRDRVDLLRTCINSIRRRTTYSNYEIIVIDNQSRDEETLRFLFDGIRAQAFRVMAYDAPFNFSAMNNEAAKLANGDILGFINNDVELITADWLEQAAGILARPEVGAVGAKLRFANGMLQHGGVVLGTHGLADNAFQHVHADDDGYFHRTQIAGNYSAVTAACLFMRAPLFDAVGGFDAVNLPVAFNDVDLCLRLREQGYLISWTPHIELYHHESLSRGRDESAERQGRAFKEEAYMRQRWQQILMRDPYYNPNLNLDGRPFTGLALPSRHRWGSPFSMRQSKAAHE